MKNSTIVNKIFNNFVKVNKYGFRMGTLRNKKYLLLKEKYKKKINNFLYRFFNLKSNPNYIIESNLSSNIKIYKVISNKNIPVVEIEFTKDLNSKLFTNFQIKIQNSITKDNDNLEKNVTLGKISKILLTKKDLILKKYNEFILNFKKYESINKQKYEKLRIKSISLKEKIQEYKIIYLHQNLSTENGISLLPTNLHSKLLHPNTLEKINFIKCNYLKNKKIEIILKSKELNKTYTYNISQEIYTKLIKEYSFQTPYIISINDILHEKWKQYRKENHEYLKTL